jgi:HrpA-like RNA helicase
MLFACGHSARALPSRSAPLSHKLGLNGSVKVEAIVNDEGNNTMLLLKALIPASREGRLHHAGRFLPSAAACAASAAGARAQVPQFLLEAGYGAAAFPERAGRIGVTQPRRVAAVAAATRIAAELGCALGGRVGYQVRARASGAG